MPDPTATTPTPGSTDMLSMPELDHALLYSSAPVTASLTSTRCEPRLFCQASATPVVPAPGISGLARTPFHSTARMVVAVLAGADQASLPWAPMPTAAILVGWPNIATTFWYSATATPPAIA